METFYGAREIEKMYLSGRKCIHAAVSEETDLVMEDLIVGNQIIKEQTRNTLELLKTIAPLNCLQLAAGAMRIYPHLPT